MYLEGRIQNRSYDDKEGNKRYISEINASKVTFLGGRGGQADSPQAPSDGYSGGDFDGGGSPGYGPSDDDIPF